MRITNIKRGTVDITVPVISFLCVLAIIALAEYFILSLLLK